MLEVVGLKSLDHVALWVSDRDAIADTAIARLGMHVIERTDRFTLIGAEARHGKLTLFEAEAPRDAGGLVHIGLRVSRLPDETELELGDGLRVVLVEAPTEVEYDLDHVALLAPDPEATRQAWIRLGFTTASSGRVEAGGAYLEFQEGDPAESEQPLLNHLGVLVDSAEEWRATAEQAGAEIADVVDAPNTYAVFVWGPDRVKLEYVEHKPEFSLA
jgi:catechol 2,3-dioxygenase-like lactoylglutathione lyase family enzyme